MRVCSNCYGVVVGARCSCRPVAKKKKVDDGISIRECASIVGWTLVGGGVGLVLGYLVMMVVQR